MGNLNTLSGALSLSIVAMSIVFAVLGGLALMMVLIKYIALLLERPVTKAEKGAEVKGSLGKAPLEERVEIKEEDLEPSLIEMERELAAIAGAVAAMSFSTGKPLRVWRISGPIKSLWRESSKVESMIGGNENE